VLGWTPRSTQAATYIHLTGEDITDAMLEAAGIKRDEEEKQKERERRCPRCKDFIPIKEKRCLKCGFSEDDTVEQQQQYINEKLAKQEKDIDALKNIISRLLDEKGIDFFEEPTEADKKNIPEW
jgi:ribosomal protein L37E